MKKITTWIANLKISSKIWLCMFTIALTLSAFLITFSRKYFSDLYKEDIYTQTADSLHIGAQSLEDSYHLLLRNVVEAASTSDFSSMVQDIHLNQAQNNARYKAIFQQSLSNLTASIPILDSIAILGKNNEYISLYTNTLKRGTTPESAFDWDFFSISDITWLSVRPSPYLRNNQIIPVIMPISQLSNTHFLHICNTPSETDLYIILLLDANEVEKRLALADSSYSDRIFYIADKNGIPISMTLTSPWYSKVCSPEISTNVQNTGRNDGFHLIYDHAQYSLYSTPLDIGELSLISIVPKNALFTRLAHMGTFFVLVTIAGLVLTASFSFALSRFVTRPFTRLIQNVHKMENNTYETPYQTKYQDEIGQLNTAINSMYTTIQKQIQQIRENERDKYRAEIQLLSAQINPHFLYNTLECINMEILNDHKQTASSMLTNLSDFMRIGLNYGDELILLSNELLHAKSYINIMNFRFSQKIAVICTIQPELMNCLILKSILQPLVENSIRHGFHFNRPDAMPLPMPEITINAYQNEESFTLEVSDNGYGIDIEKATQALDQVQTSDGRRHVGLNNVYARLKAHYQTASITFETIPYFRNTVRITLPPIAKNLQEKA